MSTGSSIQYRQPRVPRASDPVAAHHGYLVLTSAPDPAIVGKRLIDAGTLPAGDYKCAIDLSGWEKGFDVVLKPHTVSGGSFAPSVSIMLLDRATAKVTVAGSNFATDASQTLTAPASGTLTGEQLAIVSFTVPATRTITFATGLAEFSGR